MAQKRYLNEYSVATIVLGVLGLFGVVNALQDDRQHERYEIEESSPSARIRITSSAKINYVQAHYPIGQLHETNRWKMSIQPLASLLCDTASDKEEDKVEICYWREGHHKCWKWNQNSSFKRLEGSSVDLEQKEVDDIDGQIIYFFPRGRLSVSDFLVFLYLEPVDGKCPEKLFPCSCKIQANDVSRKYATRCISETFLCDGNPNCGLDCGDDEENCTSLKTPSMSHNLTLLQSCENLRKAIPVNDIITTDDPISNGEFSSRITPVFIWTIVSASNMLLGLNLMYFENIRH